MRSPFVDCDFKRIRTILQQMNTSRIHTGWFLVLDGDSDKTSTAVIVHVEEEEEGSEPRVTSLRVAYAPSSRYLSAASIAHPSLDELIEIAESTADGVLRD